MGVGGAGVSVGSGVGNSGVGVGGFGVGVGGSEVGVGVSARAGVASSACGAIGVAEGDAARVGDGATACGTGLGVGAQPATRDITKAKDTSGYMINDRMSGPHRTERLNVGEQERAGGLTLTLFYSR